MEKRQAKKFMLLLGIAGTVYSLVCWLTYKGDFPLVDIIWLGSVPLCAAYAIYLGLMKER